jgi:hypothetical protein
MAVDGSGNIYLTDTGNNRVIVYPGGATTASAAQVYGQPNLTTCSAGSGATGLNNPERAVLDGSGGLYVADSNNNRVVYYASGSTSASRVYGSGGGCSPTGLNNPIGLALDGGGGLYVADANDNRILHFPAGSTTADQAYGQPNTSSCGSGTSSTTLNFPHDVTLDRNGNLYIADTGNNRVLVFPAATSGTPVASAVYGQGGNLNSNAAPSPPTELSLNYPAGVRFDAGGALYIADQHNYRVLELFPG